MSHNTPNKSGQPHETRLTRSQTTNDPELQKIIAKNQIDPSKIKKLLQSNKTLVSSASSNKTLPQSEITPEHSINKTLVLEENYSVNFSSLGSPANKSSSIHDLSLISGSSNQDQTLTIDDFQSDISDSSKFFSSTFLPSQSRKSLEFKETNIQYERDYTDSDDNSDDQEISENIKNKTVKTGDIKYNKISKNLIPDNMTLPNNQQVSLRDALEVVPIFDGSNIPLSHFIEGCEEARLMVPQAAESNLAKLIRSKITGEARKSIYGTPYNRVHDLIDNLKRAYAPTKSVYQLQGELGNIYMWEKENVLSYAARIKELADRIEDAHKINNQGDVDENFGTELEKAAIDCFTRGLRPELEIRIKGAETFKDVKNAAMEVERKLAACADLRKTRNLKIQEEFQTQTRFKNQNKINVTQESRINCLICDRSGHLTKDCYYLNNVQQARSNYRQSNFPNSPRNFSNSNTRPFFSEANIRPSLSYDNNRPFAQNKPERYGRNNNYRNNNYFEKNNYRRNDYRGSNYQNHENQNDYSKIRNSEQNFRDKQINYPNRNSYLGNYRNSPREVPSQSFQPKNNKSPIICNYCKNPGHEISECRKRKYNDKNPIQGNSNALPGAGASGELTK